MDNNITEPQPPRFEIYRGAEAKDCGEHNLMPATGISPAIAQALTEFVAATDETQGAEVKLVYGVPGMSLSRVWFKSGYPLPLHSHSANCLYFILAGSLKIGTETLGPGDGFYVGFDVPYTYTAGPEGVEVLEFRDTDQLDIRFMSKTRGPWEKAVKKIIGSREAWKDQQPPSRVLETQT